MANRRTLSLITILFLFTSACTPFLESSSKGDILPDNDTERPEYKVISPTSPAAPAFRSAEDPHEYQLPDQFPYDAILPIYEPKFSPAYDAPLEEDELVMGVIINGEAKAYPVTVLRVREIVNDELGGIPILVSW